VRYRGAQTFLVDADAVRGAVEVYVTSVDLYFRARPKETRNRSGIDSPGAEVYLVPTLNGQPVVTSIESSVHSRVEYGSIVPSADATVATNFRLSKPVIVKTGQKYAVVVKFDGDEDFVLWTCVQGDPVVGTNKASPGPSGKVVGDYFQYTEVSDGAAWKALSGVDLKFKVNVARFGANGASFEYDLPVRNHEFVVYSRANSTGVLIGGELVYKNTAPVSGTVSVSANSLEVSVNTGANLGNTFTGAGAEHVVLSNGSAVSVRRVVSVDSNTRITLDRLPSFSNGVATWFLSPVAQVHLVDKTRAFGVSGDLLVLRDSSANSTVRFANGDVLCGELSGARVGNTYVTNVEVHDLVPEVWVSTPAGCSATLSHEVLYHSNGGNTYAINSFPSSLSAPVRSYEDNMIDYGVPVLIPSRSNEVAYNSNSAAASLASTIVVACTSNNEFTAPAIDVENTDVFFSRYLINDDATGEDGRYGAALAKGISEKVTFAEGRIAEDVLVFLTAYRPAGTDLLVYAKVHNSRDPDAFDDKSWTLLEAETGANSFSSSVDRNDFVELSFGLPQYPPSTQTLAGTVTTANGSSNVIGAGTSFNTALAVDDLVKVYQPLFPNNYVVAVVTAVTNSTQFTVGRPIANSGVVGSGMLVDLLSTKHTAFNNQLNDNVARYYDLGMVEHDGYDTMQVKIVMLSNSSAVVPRVDSVRGLGVSA
jgi:hypothetical protein